ncbi:MAG: hypothetical protein ACLP6E_15845 [Acidimicrobiales bacterium]
MAGADPAGAESPDAGAGKVKLGKANAATGTTSISMAVNGDSGVEGIDTSGGGGNGLYGSSTNGNGVLGASTNGSGVYATSTGFNAAIYAAATGDGATGVYGYQSGESGNGVYGYAANGTGVYGRAFGEGASSVYGYATGADGYGVYGYVTGEDSYGVWAYSENSDSLYVDGSAVVTGTLSKGGGSFKIDHPLDPAGKFLYHSFVESPDMKNVYDGTVALDADGRATVELPDWFEALNRDFRYTLTALDEPAPDLHISSRVKNARFSIAGGKANQEVSWQVTGIRQDAWANANRIPVEVDKKAEDQGRYLHPELFGGEPITALARAREHTHRNRHATPT